MNDSVMNDRSMLRAALETNSPSQRPRIATWRTAAVLAFYAGDLAAARRVVREASDDMPAATVLDEVLAPAMHFVGELWERDEITIADEHLATATVQQLLVEVSGALQIAPPQTRATILLATPEPERHTTGLLMANQVLYGAGYRTVLLGAGVPNSALSAALIRHQPSVVAISATMMLPDGFGAAMATVRETLPGAHLVIGGAAAMDLTAPADAHRLQRLSGLVEDIGAVLERR